MKNEGRHAAIRYLIDKLGHPRANSAKDDVFVPIDVAKSLRGRNQKMTDVKQEGSAGTAQPELTMKQLVEYIARALVDFPDQVDVEAMESQNSVILELKVAPDDVGKVIGKGGQTAKALRKILSAAATKLHKKSLLQIIE